MTAPTTVVLIEEEDGSKTELAGVMSAEETTHFETGEPGVVVQFTRQAADDDEKGEAQDSDAEASEVVFIAGASLIGVSDEASENELAPAYRAHVHTTE